MSDVAQILGVNPTLLPPPTAARTTGSSSSTTRTSGGTASSTTMSSQQAVPPPPVPTGHQPNRSMKMMMKNSVPKEVKDLVMGSGQQAQDILPPMMPKSQLLVPKGGAAEGETVKVGSKHILKDKRARQWAWAPFSSSSRTDGAVFYHWVRANVEYPDYPYARFDIHLDPVTYTEDEYSKMLTSDTWTKSETDKLMELARTFELRWAVIHDRWIGYYQQFKTEGEFPIKRIEDLQFRYYQVAAILNQYRVTQQAHVEVKSLAAAASQEENKDRADTMVLETAAAKALAMGDPSQQPYVQTIGTGSSNKVFDLEQERRRRAHMELLWKQTKAEEQEEAALRKELKEIEIKLRKIKKNGGHIAAAAQKGSGTVSQSLPGSAPPVTATDVSPEALDRLIASSAPKAMPNYPYLQSARLAPLTTGGSTGINKSLLLRMNTVIQEMNIPAQLTPTKRVCDLYDTLRKDLLSLLVLKKNILQKEGIIQTKRMRLAKYVDDVKGVSEELLLGIPQPTPPPADARSTATAEKGSSGKPGGNAKKTPSQKSKGKTATATATGTATGGTAVASSTPAVKATGKAADDSEKKKLAPKRKRKDSKSPQPASEDKKKKKKVEK